MSHQEHERAAKSITVRFAVLTLSDTRTPDTDESGRAIRGLITEAGHAIAAHDLIKDDADALWRILETWLTDDTIDAIVTTGGTGISPRDQTIPLIDLLIESPLPGFGELFRSLSFRDIGAAAMLSRAVAGIARGKLVVALPGSKNAVTLAMRELLLPQASHIVGELRK
jgi:molybdenum cofactor biosynthesis protein B